MEVEMAVEMAVETAAGKVVEMIAAVAFGCVARFCCCCCCWWYFYHEQARSNAAAVALPGLFLTSQVASSAFHMDGWHTIF